MNSNQQLQVVRLCQSETTNGAKTAFQRRWAQVWNYQSVITGTGAVSATVTIQGSNDNTNWHTIGTAMSNTGTTSDSKETNSTVPWAYHRVLIASITGTGASVTVTAAGY